MKKLISIIVFLMLFVSVIYAGSSTLLNGVETTGVSDFIVVKKVPIQTVVCHFTNTGGSVTALTVDLEGSLDTTNWLTLKSYEFDTTELAAKKTGFHLVNKMMPYIRANITTLTETGTTAVYVKYENMWN